MRIDNFNNFNYLDKVINQENILQTKEINSTHKLHRDEISLNFVSNKSKKPSVNEIPLLPQSKVEPDYKGLSSFIKDKGSLFFEDGTIEQLLTELFFQMKEIRRKDRELRHKVIEESFNYMDKEIEALKEEIKAQKISAWTKFAASLISSGTKVAGAIYNYCDYTNSKNNNPLFDETTDKIRIDKNRTILEQAGENISLLTTTLDETVGYGSKAKEMEIRAKQYEKLSHKMEVVSSTMNELIQEFKELEKEVFGRLESILEVKYQAFKSVIIR